MAIIVEDGSIVAGANSYVSEAELTAYATQRGVTLTGGTEALLVKATDYLQTLEYIGDKKTADQPLLWPRRNVTIDGFEFSSEEIPDELKNAQLALAVSIDEGNDPMATIGRKTRKEKVDVLEIEYADNSASAAIITSVNRILAKLLSGGGVGGGFFPVVRI